MAESPIKRKGDFQDSAARKMPKTGRPGKKLSFAERMMAKMGHVEGQGLGKGGDGIINPIEVNSSRPVRVGVGAVKELTKQAKEEAKRQAAKRGEVLEDSSEEERKARKKRQEQRQNRTAGKSSNPFAPPKPIKQKLKYATAADIERSAEGLQVPQVLKTIIDATGPQMKSLNSAAGLLKSASTPQEIEAEKLANRARQDLNAFANSWNELTDRAKELVIEEQEINKELEDDQNHLNSFSNFIDAVDRLQIGSSTWEDVSEALQLIHEQYAHDINADLLQQVSVASIKPLFQNAMLDWDPLQDPVSVSTYLHSNDTILGIHPSSITKSYFQEEPRKRSTTPYESLIHTYFVPKLRSAITNDWDPYDPDSLIPVFETWSTLLPDFVQYSLIDLVVKKLERALHDWNPRREAKRHSQSNSPTLPHLWLFPWLPHLPPTHTDASSPTSLLSDVARKLRHLLTTWPLENGVLPGLSAWQTPLGPKLTHTLVTTLLPRLATFLTTHLTIDPADQDLAPLHTALAWRPLLPPYALAQLLLRAFFPRFRAVLRAWLASAQADYAEIADWYVWWRAQVGPLTTRWRACTDAWREALSDMAAGVSAGGGRGVDIEMPLLAGSSAATATTTSTMPTDLSTASTSRTEPAIPPNTPQVSIPASLLQEAKKPRFAPDEEATFKDAVEAWCADEDLLLMPLREAQEDGHALYRLTASAVGRGGVVVYFKGDVVWAQKRGDKRAWEQVALDENLVLRASRK